MNSIAGVSSTGVFTSLGAFNDSLNVGVRTTISANNAGIITTMVHFDNPKYTYVGGTFLYAGNVPVYGVARYNWANSQWSELDGGINALGTVTSMVQLGNQIIVAGTFTRAGSLMVNNIAAFDLILQKWVQLNDGLVATSISKIGFFNGLLLVAGTVTGASEVSNGISANIAAFNGRQWTNPTPSISGLTPANIIDFMSLNGFLYLVDSANRVYKLPAGSNFLTQLTGFPAVYELSADYSGRPIFIINAAATGEGRIYDPILDNAVATVIGPNSFFVTRNSATSQIANLIIIVLISLYYLIN